MPKQKLRVEQVEYLLEEVRQHPILYDPRSADHKDDERICNTWSSIHGVMTRVFGKAIDDEADKEFVRCVCQEKKGDSRGRAAKRTQKWQFLDIMSFLDNYVEECRQFVNALEKHCYVEGMVELVYKYVHNCDITNQCQVYFYRIIM